ncbi:MAG: hypothetical protein WCZ28_12335 [Burkholderiaceae bacterium]
MMRVSNAAHLFLGLALWAVWFVAAYGGLSLACMAAAPPRDAGAFTGINLGLAVLTVGTAAWLAMAGVALRRALMSLPADAPSRERFIGLVSSCLYFVAAVATLFVGLPVLVLPPCP